jgi:transcriptional regulator with XRE-family HTH domain
MNVTPKQQDPGMDAAAIGRRIREARRLCGKRQAECAAHLGMSRPTYIAIENGTRGAKPGEIIALAGLFGCEVSALVADAVTRRRNGSPLLMAADLCEWVDRFDRGDVSEGQFARYVGADRVSSRIIAECCRAMAAVVARQVAEHESPPLPPVPPLGTDEQEGE